MIVFDLPIIADAILDARGAAESSDYPFLHLI